MAYEILNNDLFEDSDKRDKRKDKMPKLRDEPDSDPSKIPIAIHIILIVVVLIVIGYFVITFFDGDNMSADKELKILGGIDSFEYNYVGNLKLKANKFEIESVSGKFSDVNKEILIANFTGMISLMNKTIIVKGNSNGINYGGNSLNLKGEEFTLTSQNKVEFSMFFDNLSLSMSDAEIRLADTLSYRFKEADIELFGFNSTIIYDGTFSIEGYPNEFGIVSPTDGIYIAYVK